MSKEAPATPTKFNRLSRLLNKGFWAVTDQGLFAGSTFGLSVLLARWLAPTEYGAFAVAFAAFWMLSVLHTALLGEPMMVFGFGKYKECPLAYVGVILYGHLSLSIVGALPLLMAGLGFGLFGMKPLSLALFGAGLAQPFILFNWLMRRACYVLRRIHLAASASALYTILLFAGTYILYVNAWLSTITAFASMALAGLVTGLWLVVCFNVPLSIKDSGLLREVATSHWVYGRWALPSALLAWLPMNLYYLLLPAWYGLESSAALRALMNLVAPMWQALWALSLVLLGTLVESRHDNEKFGRRIRMALVAFSLGAILYWGFLGTLHQPLVSWLYAGRYAEYARLLWILGLLPVLICITEVLSMALRALEYPNRMFWANLLSTIVTLTLGIAFVAAYGLTGAIVGMLLGFLTAAAVMVWMLNISRKPPKQEC